MSKPEEKVLAEYERFSARLPELMNECPGKWVVFLEGEVQSSHDTADEAMATAVERFGVNGGYVVAPVAEVEPTPLTAAVMFMQPGA